MLIPALPVSPPLVAVTVAVPTTRPVTSPLAETGASAALLLVHATVRPVSTLPFASFTVAVSCTVCPKNRLVAAGLTVTAATGAGGGGVHAETATLHTVAPPTAARRPRLLRTLTAA